MNHHTLYTSAEKFRNQGVEIKPCPFCGSWEDVGLYSNPVYVPEVRCDNCGARMSGQGEQEALTDWNRRAGEQER